MSERDEFNGWGVEGDAVVFQYRRAQPQEHIDGPTVWRSKEVFDEQFLVTRIATLKSKGQDYSMSEMALAELRRTKEKAK